MPGKENAMKYSLLALGFLSLTLSAGAQPYPQAYRSSAQTRVIDDYLEHMAQMQRVTRITRKEAIAAARRAVPEGRVKEVELENHRGSVVFEIEIVNGEVEFEVIVDAGNGELLWLESEPEDYD